MYRMMRFEELMKALLSMVFLPQIRVYEDTDINIFNSIHEEILEEDILKQRIENGEIELEQEEI